MGIDSWQADELDLICSVHEDDLWACRDYDLTIARQQGKTTRVAAPRALAGLLLFGEQEIFWSAHEVKTVLESHLLLHEAFLTLGEEAGPNLIALDDGRVMIKVVNNNGFEGFILRRPFLPLGSPLPRRQRLRFIARSKGSGRGFSGDCNLNDEAFAMGHSQQEALAPTQLARPNPQDLYFSSPPLDGKSGQVLFDLRRRARAGAKRLGFRDWGLEVSLDEVARMSPETRKAFLDDVRNWFRALPALRVGRITVAAVQAMRDKMSDLGFAREILGCWPEQVGEDGGWLVVSSAAWEARGKAAGRPDGPLTLGIEVSYSETAEGQTTAIVLSGRLSERERSVQVLEYRPGTSWAPARVRKFRDDWDLAAVLMDRRGPSAALATALEEEGVEVYAPTVEEMGRGFAEFRAAVAGDDPYLRHYDQAEYSDALAVAEPRPLGDGGMTWGRVRSDADIAVAVAGGLAFLGQSLLAHDPIDDIW